MLSSKQNRTNKIEDLKANILMFGLGYFVFDAGAQVVSSVVGTGYMVSGLVFLAAMFSAVKYGLFDSLFN